MMSLIIPNVTNLFITRFQIKLKKTKLKQLVITKSSDNCVPEMVSEFKENVQDAGYKLNEIECEISDSKVCVLWPDKEDDVLFLEDWVQSKIGTLDRDKNVTFAYVAEDVCMQIGDVFNKKVNYYDWNYGQEIQEIRTDDSIIISFYRHKGEYEHDEKLVYLIKPLFEHPKVTIITFDFIYDFDKLYDYQLSICKCNKTAKN